MSSTAGSKYRDAIIDAIAELKDRRGSSLVAIQKVIKGKHPDKQWMVKAFHRAIKAGIEQGYFIRIKNSVKLASNYKQILSGMSPVASNPGERKVGRPPKQAVKDDGTSGSPNTSTSTVSDAADQAERLHGQFSSLSAGSVGENQPRKGGSPRKNQTDVETPKRPRGRPRKSDSALSTKEKKPRGRPKSASKIPSTQELINQILGKRNTLKTSDNESEGSPKKRERTDSFVTEAQLHTDEVLLNENKQMMGTEISDPGPTTSRGRPIDPSFVKLPSISPKQIANAAKAAISSGQKKKPGRPPNSVSKKQKVTTASGNEVTTGSVVKRGRGRPRRVVTENTTIPSTSIPGSVMGAAGAPQSFLDTNLPVQLPKVVAKRGRPRKNFGPQPAKQIIDPNAPKRKRGRPPKTSKATFGRQTPKSPVLVANVPVEIPVAAIPAAFANVPVEVPVEAIPEMPLIAYNITMLTTSEGSTRALDATPAAEANDVTDVVATSFETIPPTEEKDEKETGVTALGSDDV